MTLRAMPPRGSVFVSWLVIALLIGGHWGVLQVVAWTNMAISNATSMSFSDAVLTAVDGDDPCRMCRAIIKATNQDDGPTCMPMQRILKIHKIDAVLPVFFISPAIPDQVHNYLIFALAPQRNFCPEPPQRPPINV